MNVLSVLGARPQFIKAAPLCHALKMVGVDHMIVHTGQHFDQNMSQVFFDELDIQAPDVRLDIGPASQSVQTARILERIEPILTADRPAMVIVYGDTTSTLSGALAAAKLGIPIAHVEAGLRSFNQTMPEEINRILTDHVSSLLFCPSKTASAHLEREGITQGVHVTGDIMFDAVLAVLDKARSRQPGLMKQFGLSFKSYVLATLHRPYTVDRPDILAGVIRALGTSRLPVLLPLHPRTRGQLDASLSIPDNVILAEPLGFLDMVAVEQAASLIATDSGGVQKEAFFLGIPCITMRPETEWVETLEGGWNRLTGSDPNAIRQALADTLPPCKPPPPVYGNGQAAIDMASRIKAWLT